MQGSARETLKAFFFYTFSVTTINDLVERKGFNEVLKAGSLDTEGWMLGFKLKPLVS